MSKSIGYDDARRDCVASVDYYDIILLAATSRQHGQASSDG